MLSRALARVRGESGVAMVLAVFATALLATVALLIVDATISGTQRSADAVQSQSAYEAAESGIDDYVAKLTDDQVYYLHSVDPAESTRADLATGTRVAATGDCSNPASKPAPVAWTLGVTWSYPNGKDRWCSLGNGYEYNLRIYPPSLTQTGVRIVAAGRRTGSTTSSDQRVLEAVVARSSITDFQMVSNVSISYGSDATTNGKVYANGDINHDGTATGDLYAEGRLTGSTLFTNNAHGYDMNTSTSYPSLDTVPALKGHHPISFLGFLTSFDDISRAATSSGISLDDSTKDAWWLTFNSNGTVSIKSCKKTAGNVEDTLPTCTTPAAWPVPVPVPSNGAIHVQQSAIVSGVVNGRVTVASENDIIVGGNITYVQPGDDVLGLEAKSDLWVAEYTPTALVWSAATLTQSGSWSSASSSGSHNSMVFTGSTATASGGQMAMFDTRIYNYDTNLLFLPPPWFPTLATSWATISFRELPSSS